MRKLKCLIVAALVAGLFAAPVCAEHHNAEGGKVGAMLKQSVDTFVDGCGMELSAYCKDVNPGKGRLLACLYAHDDKLSLQCNRAMLDSLVQLDQAVTDLKKFAAACDSDLDTFCATVEPGGGRLLDCLEKNETSLNPTCRKAFKEMK